MAAALTKETLAWFESKLLTALTILLQDRFIYQTVRIDFEDLNPLKVDDQFRKIFKLLTENKPEKEEAQIAGKRDAIRKTLEGTVWNITDPTKDRRKEDQTSPYPCVAIPRYVRACGQCGNASSPFIARTETGLPKPVSAIAHTKNTAGKLVQMWLVTYHCAACDNEPIYLMVRREGLRLSIVGRSLFEAVGVPKPTPKGIEAHYRDSLISRSGGKGLAAALYLRVSIEQHMRTVLDAGDMRMDGEALSDGYARLLDREFPSQFRSLRIPYEELSLQIHSGQFNAEKFDQMLEHVDRHFAQLELLPIKTSEKTPSSKEESEE